MTISKVLVSAIIVLIAITLSCERSTKELKMDVVSELKSIPQEYGSLISVTTLAEYPDWVQMWFQDNEGVIRIVRVQFFADLIHNKVKVIARD